MFTAALMESSDKHFLWSLVAEEEIVCQIATTFALSLFASIHFSFSAAFFATATTTNATATPPDI